MKITRVLAVITVVLGTVGSSAVSASAAAPAAAPAVGSSHESAVGMYVAGFDPAVAAAHGYRIVTHPDGSRQSVPARAGSTLRSSAVLRPGSVTAAALPERQPALAAANTDYNSVQGNCGLAWIRVSQTGTNKVAIASGFRNTPEPAYFWTWDVQLTDRNGTSHQRYSGAILNTQASRTWQNLNQYGYTYDYVYAGGATLVDGTICLAGRPDVSITL